MIKLYSVRRNAPPLAQVFGGLLSWEEPFWGGYITVGSGTLLGELCHEGRALRGYSAT